MYISLFQHPFFNFENVKNMFQYPQDLKCIYIYIYIFNIISMMDSDVQDIRRKPNVPMFSVGSDIEKQLPVINKEN